MAGIRIAYDLFFVFQRLGLPLSKRTQIISGTRFRWPRKRNEEKKEKRRSDKIEKEINEKRREKKRAKKSAWRGGKKRGGKLSRAPEAVTVSVQRVVSL